MNRLRATLAVLVLGWAVNGLAADDDKVIVPGASRTEAPAQTAAGGLGSMSLTLGLVLAAVGGWMVWRNRRGTPVGRDSRLLAVDETRSLGNRQYLVIASYADKKFLIGVCPGRIDLLSPLDGTAPVGKARE